MQFEHDTTAESMGFAAGFAFAYLLFSTVLYLIFTVLRDVTWAYPKYLALAGAILLIGHLLRKALQ